MPDNEEKQSRILSVAKRLEAVYPDAVCALHWEGNPWKLLIMGSLSAQCTDARVNSVCKDLFQKFPTPELLAQADVTEIEDCIRPCGLYRVKARNIREASRMLVTEYGGKMPDSMEDLLRFAGVGRKVANLILGDLYATGGTVADTHCIRICGRLGMYPESEKNPYKVEKMMNELLPQAIRSDFCHRLVLFGRDICTARGPKCDLCPIGEFCPHNRSAQG